MLNPPIALRCEHLTDPIGLTKPRPRLSWQLEATERGVRQTGYQIVAELEAAGGGEAHWDSGEVQSEQTHLVPWAGSQLPSRQRVRWWVRVWDAAGDVSPWSEPAVFEMGLFQQEDWAGAAWIGGDRVGGPRTPTAAPHLRRAFELEQGVKAARLYITALGLYEARLNGRRVGDHELSPGWTDYHQRVHYQTYDVTDHVQAGPNVLGATLGDGWYCGHVANRDRQLYAERPKLLARLAITFDDGSTTDFVTNRQWKWADSATLAGDLIMGEHFDARREAALGGWDEPGFEDSDWFAAASFEQTGAALHASPSEPIRQQEQLTPIAEPRRKAHGWVFDLGQNMVGRVRLRLPEMPAGRTLRIRHAEMCHPDGTIYTDNLRSAAATDYYTTQGRSGGETWEPRFTFHGFGYVEIHGWPIEPPPGREVVTGVVLHSDCPSIGQFECSDPRLNQLQHNIVWGQKGNWLDLPTDCPQRDERLGWTGDAQVFASTASFNRSTAGFFAKYQQDLVDAQDSRGAIPPFAPDARPDFGQLGGDGGPAWADAFVICPHATWQAFGDLDSFDQHWPQLERFIDYLTKQDSVEGIRRNRLSFAWGGFGDWLDPAIEKADGRTPKDLIGTAYVAHAAGLLAEAGQALGKPNLEKLRQVRADAIHGFRREFVTASGRVAGETQTSYLVALAFDLLGEDQRPHALAHLTKLLEQAKYHLQTGFVGTPLLLPVLSRFGRHDLAYRVLMHESYPGWLYTASLGATTMWERWNSWTPEAGFGNVAMNSFNHYAYGAVGQWLYQTIAGISPAVAGYKRSRIAPIPGGGLTWAKASHLTPYGELASSWSREEHQFTLNITVPPNTEADVELPGPGRCLDGEATPAKGNRRFNAASGNYRFEATLQ